MLSLLLAVAAAAAPTCDVVTYGARPGDGRSDSQAFDRAIRACEGRGGRVVVPAGTFDLGQVRLGSDMEFHLAGGAVLKASTRLEDFPAVPALDGHRAFVVATGATNLLLSGSGTIDGSGPAYWSAVRLTGYRDTELAPDADVRRFRFGLAVQGCRNLRVRDLTVRDTPMFLMAVKDCDDVVIDGVTLTAPDDSPNTDGLQIIDSSDVRVSNCNIAVGDDAIVTKARTRIIERLIVTGCRLRSDDGAIKFGTRSESGVRDSIFSNIVIDESRYGIALFMIHGGVYENNRFSDIRIATGGRHPRHYAVFVDVDNRAPQRGLGRIRGLTFSGLDITTGGNILIGGHPAAPVEDLTLSDIRMRVTGAQDLARTASKPRGNRRFNAVPGSPDHSAVAAHVVLGDVRGATIRGLDVSGSSASDRRPALATPSSSGIRGELSSDVR